MRADLLLVARGLAASRSQAARLIESGATWLDRTGWRSISKSDDLPDDAQIELANRDEAKYVSRGGLKLEGALKQANISVKDRVCLDIGQSTGGFTDCLLQHGAAHVVGVDVGHMQLHAKLKQDVRVTCLEQVNARDQLASALSQIISAKGKPRFACIDVSFISQTLLLSQLALVLDDHAHNGADVLALVKPQFELQPGQLAKGGIVKDASLYAQVEQRIRTAYAAHGFTVQQFFKSPILGGDGNTEFFAHCTKR
jgi:23S rRNA (cytidine1920-2'-O)/16S rRNA (cytidine1409-2'-O)-methyltransferase